MSSLMFLFCLTFVTLTNAYFTLPGKCPSVDVQKDFKLADFYDKWYQVYHYASETNKLSNCFTVELKTKSDGIYLNQSRVDRGLFHRYSMAKLEIPTEKSDAAKLNVTFTFDNAPRRLMKRTYQFYILATNYNYYATVYSCQYSPLIDKHYMYVSVLSRNLILNDVSKELAIKPLKQLNINAEDLVKDVVECNPKYYEDSETDPVTYRFPVAM